MFTRTELQLIVDALDSHRNYGPASQTGIADLHKKVSGAIKDNKGGAYRGSLAHVSDTDLDSTAWLDEADELVDQMVIDENQKLIAAKDLRRSLEKRVDELQAQLGRLQDVETIRRENERLHLELQASGPQEWEKQAAAYKKAIATLQSEAEVYKRQIISLKSGLRDERIDRMHVDRFVSSNVALSAGETRIAALLPPSEPGVNPCRHCNKPLNDPDGYRIFCDRKCSLAWDRANNA